MTGYVFTEKGIYNSMKLIPEKSYKYEGDINGILYTVMSSIDELFFYYKYNKNTTVIFEVEIINRVNNEKIFKEKILCDNIKVIREIDKTEYNSLFEDYVFDDDFNIIEKKSENFKYEYDENERLIHIFKGEDIDTLYEWNDNKLVHFKCGNYEEWYEYDNRGNMIKFKDSRVTEEYYTYDEKNQLIYVKKTPNDHETWMNYDEKGNLILQKINSGLEKFAQYDENNNIVNFKTNDGYEFTRQYDKDNNLICHEEYPLGVKFRNLIS